MYAVRAIKSNPSLSDERHNTTRRTHHRAIRTDSVTNLSVLVDEHERVGHVPVSQVHDAQADPRAARRLDYSQDSTHLLAHRRALLDPTETTKRRSKK